MSARKVALSGLWAFTVYTVLTVCALALVDAYGEAVLPLYRWEVGWVAPQYQLRDLNVDRASAEPTFKVTARNNDYLYVDGKVFSPGSCIFRGAVGFEPGLQHVVLVLLVPLAWPGLTWKRRVAALACAIPVLGVLEFVDIPLAIVGGLDLTNATYNHTPDSLAMVWSQILDTGGRLALGLAGGLVACGLPSAKALRCKGH